MGFLFIKNSQDKQAVRQEDVARLVEPPHKGLLFPDSGWKDGRSEETTAEPAIKGETQACSNRQIRSTPSFNRFEGPPRPSAKSVCPITQNWRRIGTGQLFWGPLGKGGSSNPLSELAGQTNQSGSQHHRRQMTCPHLRIPLGPLGKGGSSNPLSELAGQTNQSGSQHHRRQMTCPHLRIPSSSFLGRTTSFSGSNPSKAVSALYPDRFETVWNRILPASRSFSWI